ncbi:MAG: cytochrome c biogenesis protein CcsA [Anaerolineae bacterium]|jgi:cytochrome c-type biogenesis protein CcmF|nr:cytochrome c biogenesis protein CcsA [Anaerolineae bacterium]
MLAEVGFISTWLSIALAVYAAAAAAIGHYRRQPAWTHSARNAVFLVFGALSVSVGTLLVALITEQYQLAYVWSVSNPSMPMVYRVTALWGSQAGSLLFWCWMMSAFSALSVATNWRSNYRLMPHVIIFQMVLTGFFTLLLMGVENPFARYWVAGADVLQSALQPAGTAAPALDALSSTAKGLNPLLRHFGMVIHPPLLYLGFVGFLVPCAFAFAALATGDLSTQWIKASRRWSLVAWVFLGLGLVLGGRWAYDVLGWGGYWGWDPVENAAFLPWLIGTAYLHSIMIQEKRGMFKTWNMALIVATFSAVIFGTFATRSGLVESVHSFARSDIGFPMLAMWFSVTFTLIVLIVWRQNAGHLRDDHPMTGILSRESLFLLNNFIFIALFIAVFWGSFGAPILSEQFFDTKITLGAEYFLNVTPPLFLALFVLMGVAPLAGWGVSAWRRIGQGLIVPLLLSIATVIGFVLLGHRTPITLVGYGIVALAGWVAAYETYRAVRARQFNLGEGVLTALGALARRNPRRYGGYLTHIGVVIIGIGIIGSTAYQRETQATLPVGGEVSLDGYTLRYAGFEGGQIAEDGRIMDIAIVEVYRGGQLLSTLRPRRDFFPQQTDMNSMTIAAAHSTLENDVYLLLLDWDEISQDNATFKVYINPLINLVWWGALVLIAGMAVGLYPTVTPETSPRRTVKPVSGLAEGSA